MSDPCAKLIYTPQNASMFSDPSSSGGDVQPFSQPETDASAAAQGQIGAGLNDALMNLFAPLRNLTGGG